MAITPGWQEVMYKTTKVQGVDMPLGLDKVVLANSLLSIAYMFLFSVLILNLFIGIVSSAQNREHEKLKKLDLLMPF